MHPYQHAQSQPDKPAYIMAESGEVVTYAQLERRSNQGAHLFRSLGLSAGDTLAIFMHNNARYMEVVWASQRAGLYYVGVSSALTAAELAYILKDSGAKALIYSAELAEVARKAAREIDALQLYACSGDPHAHDSFELARARFTETPIADESPGQDMLYSSGTTGRPKGIRFPPLTGTLEADATVTALARKLYGFDSDTIFLSPAPLYHAAPLRFVFAVHQVGGTAILMAKFDAERALSLIERYRISHAQWVPTHFVRMLKLPVAARTRHDLASLKVAFHAAAPCPIDVKARMLDWWGPIIHEYYGSTEMIGLTACSPQEWLDRPGTVGRAKLGEIHICADDDTELPPRTEGVVYFFGGTPLRYHNDPDKTREAHNERGWVTVGDVGWVDEEGYLYLTDRKSFMIISGGVNIYPQEIENALVTHSAVTDAAVIGVPDAEMGENVVAVIQPADGSLAGEALTAELQQYLRDLISPIKMPRTFIYVRELPRQPTGKLFKRLIREQYLHSNSNG